MSSLFDASRVGHILLVGPLAYVAMIVLLRGFGKRTLSKMNAFDFVVTVALGSLLATIVIDDQVSLLEGVVGILVLLVGQFIITFFSSRSRAVTRLVKATPALVYGTSGFLDDVLSRERVSREEVVAAARTAGFASLDRVDAVVLETDGTFSVLTEGGTSDELPYVEARDP